MLAAGRGEAGMAAAVRGRGEPVHGRRDRLFPRRGWFFGTALATFAPS